MRLQLRKHFRHARRRVGKWLLPALGPPLLHALAATWRIQIRGDAPKANPANSADGKRRRGGRLVALWHGRMLIGATTHAHERFHVLVSPSPDGAISTRTLNALGFEVIRGSTSRGSPRALREMLAKLEEGAVIAVTPDGPRGPRHSVAPGVVWLARATGYPIHPVALVTDRAWRLSSWDGFTIPKPHARVVADWREPIFVSRGANEQDLARAGEQLRECLLDAERRALAELGSEVDW